MRFFFYFFEKFSHICNPTPMSYSAVAKSTLTPLKRARNCSTGPKAQFIRGGPFKALLQASKEGEGRKRARSKTATAMYKQERRRTTALSSKKGKKKKEKHYLYII